MLRQLKDYGLRLDARHKAWMGKFIWIYLWIYFLLCPYLHTTCCFSLSSPIPRTAQILCSSTNSHWKLERKNLVPNDSTCIPFLYVSELGNTGFFLLFLDLQEQMPKIYCKILNRNFHLLKNKRAVNGGLCSYIMSRLRPSQNLVQICTVIKYVFFIATYLSQWV